MSLAERVSRGLKATILAKLAFTVSNAVLVLVLTRYLLDPEAYGLLYFALSVLGIFGIVSGLGLPKSTARYVAEYGERDPAQIRYILRRSVLYVGALATVVGLAVTVGGDDVARMLGEPRLAPFLVFAVGFLLFRTFNNYLMSVFQGFNRVTWSAVVESVSGVARLGFGVGFVLLGFGAVGVLLGYIAGFALAVAVGGLVLYARFYRRHPEDGRPESGLARRLVEYSVPLTATQAAGVVDKKIDTVLVGVLLDPVAVSYYVVGKQVTDFVSIPATALGFTISPTYGEHKASGEVERAARIYEESLEYVLLLYLPAAVGLVVVAGPTIRHVFGPGYLGATPVLQIFSVYVVVTAVNKVTSDGLDYLGLARDRAKAKMGMAGANFVLNLLLIPTIGVAGAAIATVVTFSAYTLTNVHALHGELPLRFGWIARVAAINLAISGGMALAVLGLLSYASTLVALLAVVGFGASVWATLAVASGLLDVRRVVDLLA